MDENIIYESISVWYYACKTEFNKNHGKKPC